MRERVPARRGGCDSGHGQGDRGACALCCTVLYCIVLNTRYLPTFTSVELIAAAEAATLATVKATEVPARFCMQPPPTNNQQPTANRKQHTLLC